MKLAYVNKRKLKENLSLVLAHNVDDFKILLTIYLIKRQQLKSRTKLKICLAVYCTSLIKNTEKGGKPARFKNIRKKRAAAYKRVCMFVYIQPQITYTL